MLLPQAKVSYTGKPPLLHFDALIYTILHLAAQTRIISRGPPVKFYFFFYLERIIFKVFLEVSNRKPRGKMLPSLLNGGLKL